MSYHTSYTTPGHPRGTLQACFIIRIWGITEGRFFSTLGISTACLHTVLITFMTPAGTERHSCSWGRKKSKLYEGKISNKLKRRKSRRAILPLLPVLAHWLSFSPWNECYVRTEIWYTNKSSNKSGIMLNYNKSYWIKIGGTFYIQSFLLDKSVKESSFNSLS